MYEALNRLTLVMPTYERQRYALRSMKFWDLRGPKILVLDGSASSLRNEELSEFGDKIEYYHWPVDMLSRIRQSLPLVKTEFVAFLCDDEFYLPSGLEACISELAENSSLLACSGRALGFYVRNKNLYSRPQYPGLADHQISQHTGEERVRFHMENYVPSHSYAVCRSDLWLNAWSYLTANEQPFFAASEVQFEIMMSFWGKSKILQALTWLRSYEAEPVRGSETPNLNPKLTIRKFFGESGRSREANRFILDLEGEINRHSLEAISSQDLRDVIESFILSTAKSKKYSARVKEFLPLYIVRLLRKLLSRSQLETAFYVGVEHLDADGVSIHYRELTEIERCIKLFHM